MKPTPHQLFVTAVGGFCVAFVALLVTGLFLIL